MDKSPSGRLETPLKPRVTSVLYLAAVLLGRGKNCACEGEKGKRGALKMTEFTSDSESASCVSFWEKNSEPVTKNYRLFEYSWGRRFLAFQKVFRIEA